MSIYDDIREIPILEIADKLGITVKRNQALCFKGHDKKPSLSFNTNKNYFNCFGCNVAGDGLNLVKEYLTLDTGKAIEWVRANFQIKESGDGTPRVKREIKQAETPDRGQFAGIYRDFIDSLPSVEESGYLTTRRGISRAVLDRNDIKHIPDGYDLTPIIKKHGEAVKASGLLSEGFSFVACDYVFPFYQGGQIVYLQGVFKDREKKYKNLTGRAKPLLYLPKQFSEYQGEVYITEGVLDALSFVEAGINAVAIIDAGISGDKLTELNTLKPFACVLCGDNDLTGLKAEAVLAEYMLKNFFKVKHLDIQRLADGYGITSKVKDGNDLLRAIKERTA